MTMEMQPQSEDRMSQPETRGVSSTLLILAAVVIVALGAYIYISSREGEPPPADPASAIAPATTPVAQPELPPAPDIPMAETEPDTAPPEVAPEPEPITLEQSDEVLRESLSQAGDSALLASALADSNLLERGVAVIDGFNRGLVLPKILPFGPPTKAFSTVEVEGVLYLDPASYQRHDSYAKVIAGLDTAQLVRTFHLLRPLLEQVYAGLGYSADAFDNALIRALDRVLATPEINRPIEVHPVEAVYQYTEPALEELDSVQKQLLRMGPENIAKIQRQAAALRRGLLQSPG